MLDNATVDLAHISMQVEVVYLEHCTETSCYDPTTATVFQEDAPDQLTTLSWPERLGTLEDPLIKFEDLQNRYYFDDSAGEGIDMYIVDSGMRSSPRTMIKKLTIRIGANLEHPEFADVKSRVRWIQVNPQANTRLDGGATVEDDSQTDPLGQWNGKAHGTAMLSLVRTWKTRFPQPQLIKADCGSQTWRSKEHKSYPGSIASKRRHWPIQHARLFDRS